MELADALYPVLAIWQAGIFYRAQVCVGHVSGLAARRICHENRHPFNRSGHARTAVMAHHRPTVFEISGQGSFSVAQ